MDGDRVDLLRAHEPTRIHTMNARLTIDPQYHRICLAVSCSGLHVPQHA